MKKFCDARVVAGDLLAAGVISRGDVERINYDVNLDRANSNLYCILNDDPSTRKLKALSEALKKDTSIDGHVKLAEDIDEFLESLNVK